MTYSHCLYISLFFFLPFPICPAYHNSCQPPDSNSLSKIIDQAWEEYLTLEKEIQTNSVLLDQQIRLLQSLANTRDGLSTSEVQAGLIDYLLARENAERQLELKNMKLIGLRYRKGVDFIKLLYEKILSLEHHFITLQTLQNIQTISNPNNFDEFKTVDLLIQSQVGKKQELSLPEVFQSNPYVSLVSSIVGSFIGSASRDEREANLKQVACILDFTVRMHSDLKLIYFETEYLKSNALALKHECEETFAEYVELLGYSLSLRDCREEDDWLQLDKKIEDMMLKLTSDSSTFPAPSEGTINSQQADLEFSIHRLYQFMQRYAAFVDQGTHYYHKFIRILNTYQNEALCRKSLPEMLFSLQRDMEYAREKFKTAYYMKELQGSKLKELLFGFSL